ncbi:hypothetical protein [Motilibacter deserti]|uniref:Uncharacterized protein n=1 Tax=Motilibacter deserti TaxID=2714956 RepID=A0ABX0GPH8_9ACTN|nr:hypothetical protein [Motilibacter deserti]NHC12748.1 hypothetical protein [Motilibacter deserti]
MARELLARRTVLGALVLGAVGQPGGALAAGRPTLPAREVLRGTDWANRTYSSSDFGPVRMQRGRAALDDVTDVHLRPVRYGSVAGTPSALVPYLVIDVPSLQGADDKPIYLGLHLFQAVGGKVVQVAAGEVHPVPLKGWQLAFRGGRAYCRPGPGRPVRELLVARRRIRLAR